MRLFSSYLSLFALSFLEAIANLVGIIYTEQTSRAMEESKNVTNNLQTHIMYKTHTAKTTKMPSERIKANPDSGV